MLDSDELLRLENIFIDLKNQGKSKDEIIRILDIDLNIINQWDENYDNAIKAIPENLPVTVTIKGKDASGKYLYAQSLNVTLSVLEKIKFDLYRHSFIDEKSLIDSPNKEYFIGLSRKAKEAHDILGKYVTNVSIKEKENNSVNFTYNVKSDDEDVKTSVNEALKFYFNTIYTVERIASQGQLIKKNSENQFMQATDSLPIAIKTIAIKNYLGIKDILIENLTVDSKWIFITGENGFGKTVLLQALAIGLNGTKDGDTNLLEDFSSHINIEFKKDNENLINNIWSNYSFKKLDELACYGPSRLQVNAEEAKNEIGKKNSTTYSLFNPNGILLDIELELIINKYSNPTLFETYCNIFKKLIPTLDAITVNESDKKIYYTEKDVENETPFQYQVRFNQLASGVRSLMAMVGDMILRLSKSQPNIKDFTKLSGIVIIDEVDLHWHPKWQREIPKILSELFPKIQFIATTHSPLPLLGAPKNSIFLKVERNIHDGIMCRKVDIDIEKLMPNSLFTSPLFDMDSITNVNIKSLDDVDTTDDYKEIEKEKIVKKNIANFEKGNEKFPDELFK